MSAGRIPKFQIKRAALDAVGRTYADVLAECIFWMQSGRANAQGRISLYKTGPELGRELGMAARTANRHLKVLSDRGYWDLKYKPRPGHTSPVTWVEFGDASHALLAQAKLLSEANDRRVTKRTASRPIPARSVGPRDDLQTSQNEPFLQTDHSDLTSSETQKAFLLSKERDEDGRKEPARKSGKDRQEGQGTLKIVPSYARARVREGDREFVTDFCLLAAERGLPEWPTTSSFTWEHAGEIRRKLRKVGVLHRDHQREFLADVLARWDDIRPCMEWHFSQHPTNAYAPSSMAFAMQFDVIHTFLRPPAKLSLAEQGFKTFSSLDEGF